MSSIQRRRRKKKKKKAHSYCCCQQMFPAVTLSSYFFFLTSSIPLKQHRIFAHMHIRTHTHRKNKKKHTQKSTQKMSLVQTNKKKEQKKNNERLNVNTLTHSFIAKKLLEKTFHSQSHNIFYQVTCELLYNFFRIHFASIVYFQSLAHFSISFIYSI